MLSRMIVGLMLVLISTIGISAQDHIITQTGNISAQGDGTIALNGSGEVTITGDGLLFIVDRIGTATVTITSKRRYYHQERQLRGNSTTIYRRFQGTATIQGDDIALVMNGTDISVSVSGTGMMLLKGAGDYTLDNRTHNWTESGIVINLDEIENK